MLVTMVFVSDKGADGGDDSVVRMMMVVVTII
jgi:hypothetical protein